MWAHKTCGAKTRTGKPCQNSRLFKNGRCIDAWRYEYRAEDTRRTPKGASKSEGDEG
jgi:hypothetical protein